MKYFLYFFLSFFFLTLRKSYLSLFCFVCLLIDLWMLQLSNNNRLVTHIPVPANRSILSSPSAFAADHCQCVAWHRALSGAWGLRRQRPLGHCLAFQRSRGFDCWQLCGTHRCADWTFFHPNTPPPSPPTGLVHRPPPPLVGSDLLPVGGLGGTLIYVYFFRFLNLIPEFVFKKKWIRSLHFRILPLATGSALMYLTWSTYFWRL